jgi:hypothetical protein
MKAHIKIHFLMSVITAGFGLIPTGQLSAQTFSVLHNFSAENKGATRPSAGLISIGTNLYGVTEGGGGGAVGAVVRVSTNGMHFTNLYSFASASGIYPRGRLVLSGNTLYGTMSQGGPYGGTVFAINTDGTDCKTMKICKTRAQMAVTERIRLPN